MKKNTRALFAALWGVLALAAAATALRLCLLAPAAEPVLLSSDGDPAQTAAEFLDCLCGGDYALASSYVLGGLPAEEPPQDGDAARLWALVEKSWAWERAGEAVISGTTARQAIRFTVLDAAAVTADMNADVNALLERYVEEAALASDIYNDDDSYKEEVVLRAWNEAYAARLAAAGQLLTDTLELELRYENGRWQVVGSDALLRLMAGGA